jgi:uncharacterized SAM-binding protein YcdF (DUF218 family)
MYYNLGRTKNTVCITDPDYIVALGGGGIPSESGLMRTYKAAQLSLQYPNAKVIIALPGDTSDCLSSINLMRHEIIYRGVDSSKIQFEPTGTNTRMQALQILSIIDVNSKILLVTSPEHMYRAIKVFKTAGMINTSGNPAFEMALESDLGYNMQKLGGNKLLLDFGDKTQFRYQFWNHFKYQIIIYREYFAISYYKIKGWI